MSPENRSEHLKLELELLDGAVQPTSRAAAGDGSQPAILVLESDPELRAYIVRCVEESRGPVAVVEAATTAEALRVLTRRVVVLLIAETDGHGPTGADLCRRARHAAGESSLPIVLVVDELRRPEVTGVPDWQGPSRLITKPFNARRLCDALDELLGADPGV